MGGVEEPEWVNKRAKAKEMAGGGGRVAHSAAFWEKVTDNMQQEKVEEQVEEKRKEEKERLLPGGRKIQSSAAFWEQMAENIGCKWEGEELDEGDKKWEDKGRKWEEGGRKWEGRGKKVGAVKCWEVRGGILEERRKDWAEGEQSKN